LLLTRLKLH
jgi:hypothetical protein